MNYNLPSFLCALTIAASAYGFNANAEELKIAVVDMQEALNKFYKTDVEVDHKNGRA